MSAIQTFNGHRLVFKVEKPRLTTWEQREALGVLLGSPEGREKLAAFMGNSLRRRVDEIRLQLSKPIAWPEAPQDRIITEEFCFDVIASREDSLDSFRDHLFDATFRLLDNEELLTELNKFLIPLPLCLTAYGDWHAGTLGFRLTQRYADLQ